MMKRIASVVTFGIVFLFALPMAGFAQDTSPPTAYIVAGPLVPSGGTLQPVDAVEDLSNGVFFIVTATDDSLGNLEEAELQSDQVFSVTFSVDLEFGNGNPNALGEVFDRTNKVRFDEADFRDPDSGSITDGTWTFHVQAKDAAGNRSAAVSKSFLLNTRGAPVLTSPKLIAEANATRLETLVSDENGWLGSNAFADGWQTNATTFDSEDFIAVTSGEGISAIPAGFPTGSTAGFVWWDSSQAPHPTPPGSTDYYFRRVFDIHGQVVRAALFAQAADRIITIYLNGEVVFEESTSEPVLNLDVASSLKEGTNLIAVRVEDDGDAPHGLIVHLESEVESETGGSIDLRWSSAGEETTGYEVYSGTTPNVPIAEEFRISGDAPLPPSVRTFAVQPRSMGELFFVVRALGDDGAQAISNEQVAATVDAGNVSQTALSIDPVGLTFAPESASTKTITLTNSSAVIHDINFSLSVVGLSSEGEISRASSESFEVSRITLSDPGNPGLPLYTGNITSFRSVAVTVDREGLAPGVHTWGLKLLTNAETIADAELLAGGDEAVVIPVTVKVAGPVVLTDLTIRSTENDPDGQTAPIIESGESFNFDVSVQNQGQLTLPGLPPLTTDLALLLTVDNPAVNFVSSNRWELPELAEDETRDSSDLVNTFVLEVRPDAINASTFNVYGTVIGREGGVVTHTLPAQSIPVFRVGIALDSLRVDDRLRASTDNNNDGQIGPDEFISLPITIENSGQSTFTDVTSTLKVTPVQLKPGRAIGAPAGEFDFTTIDEPFAFGRSLITHPGLPDATGAFQFRVSTQYDGGPIRFTVRSRGLSDPGLGQERAFIFERIVTENPEMLRVWLEPLSQNPNPFYFKTGDLIEVRLAARANLLDGVSFDIGEVALGLSAATDLDNEGGPDVIEVNDGTRGDLVAADDQSVYVCTYRVKDLDTDGVAEVSAYLFDPETGNASFLSAPKPIHINTTFPVVPAVSITSAQQSVRPRAQLTLRATNGRPPYVWWLDRNVSGATLSRTDLADAPFGAEVTYTAGSTLNATDTIKVQDSTGVEASALLTVQRRGSLPETPAPCLLATAVAGTPWQNSLQFLREVRDEHLVAWTGGEAVMRWYYGWMKGFDAN